MLECEVNPPGIAADFHGGLVECFPGWGDESVSRWYFERGVAGPPADRVVLREGGALVAGCGVNYRQLRRAAGAPFAAAVITSAWTRPAERKRGCFARLLLEAVAVARGRGCAVVLAFVTADNASARGLARAGAALFPASYLSSTPATPRPRRPRLDRWRPAVASWPTLRRLAAARARAASAGCHVFYPSVAAFASQMIHRPHPVVLLRRGGGWALVEETADTDRVLLLVAAEVGGALAALLERALERGRKLFLYAASEAISTAADRLGLAARAGHLAALIADSQALARALDLGLGRAWTAADSRPLAAAGGPWYLGPWRIDGGDRM